MAVSSLLNGERTVVVLFLGCVLRSLPLPLLLPHGAVLCLLAVSALSLEILVEASRLPFKTRPGASSGILLGTVTLPTVMLSKLVQLVRAYPSDEIGLQELDYQGVQYWAASTSCFILIILLCLVLSCSSSKSSSRVLWGAKTGFGCLTASSLLLILSYSGMHISLTLPWLLFHGFAAVLLLQHLLSTFPSCASIGEALLVTVGLVLYFGDMLACALPKLHGFWDSPGAVVQQYGIKRSEISIIIQGMLLGLLLFPIIFKVLFQLWDWLPSTAYLRATTSIEKSRCLIFVVSLGVIMAGFVPYWMQLVHDFQMHPFLWVVMFVFSEPVKRLSLCIYWLGIICIAVQRFYHISKHSKIERILLRKYYHLMAVLMFLPAVIFQPKFLDLAFGAALAAFLVLEIIRESSIVIKTIPSQALCLRVPMMVLKTEGIFFHIFTQVWRIWPLGQLVHQFMSAFTDHRDSDLLIVSHFSLLLGCALPIWMSSGYNDRPLAPFAGILSLGIGDTMASMVGHKYGVLRWSKSGKKTIEGTAAGITSVLATCSVLVPVLASTGYIFTQWLSLLLAVVVSGLLEAYTAQLDNAFIPLVFYSLLCL